MGRVFKIFKFFLQEKNHIPLSFLIEELAVSLRTIQKDIQVINKMLIKVSNCQVENKNGFLKIIGDDYYKVVSGLINDHFNHQEIIDENKFYFLILFLGWQKNPVTTSNLLTSNHIDLYTFKKYKKIINHYFIFYNYDMKIIFINKKGWVLSGNEKDIRFLMTNILIANKSFVVTTLNPHIFYIHDKLKKILNNITSKDKFDKNLLWFLLIFIKRNKSLFFIKEFLIIDSLISTSCLLYIKKIINFIIKEFSLVLNDYEISYLTLILVFNLKNTLKILNIDFLDQMNKEIIINILKRFKNYYSKNLILKKINFFFEKYFLKIYFNYFPLLNPLNIKGLYYDYDYFYSWEILRIIKITFVKFVSNCYNYDFFNYDFLFIFLNIFFEKEKMKIPLYLNKKSSESVSYLLEDITLKINKIFSYLHIVTYFQIFETFDYYLDNFKILIYDESWQNKNYIVLENKFLLTVKYDLSKRYKLIFDIVEIINLYLRKKILQKIDVWDYFYKKIFLDIKDLLFNLNFWLLKKYKFNDYFFDLKNAYFNKKFVKDNVLVINQVIGIDIDLPIILFYFFNPLFFLDKYRIKFVFVVLNKINNYLIELFIKWFINQNEKVNNFLEMF